MATTTNNSWPIPAATDLVKNGYDAIDDLGNAIDSSVGTGLLAWQSYTPTISGWSGTWDAKWAQLGKTLIVSGVFTLSSATVSGSFLFSLPSGKTARATGGVLGTARVSQAVNAYGACALNTTTQGVVIVYSASGSYTTPVNLAAGVPGAWSIGSTVNFTMVLEVV